MDEGESEVERPETAEPISVDADQLFAGQREIVIIMRGECYRLRITRRGRLILTK